MRSGNLILLRLQAHYWCNVQSTLFGIVQGSPISFRRATILYWPSLSLSLNWTWSIHLFCAVCHSYNFDCQRNIMRSLIRLYVCVQHLRRVELNKNAGMAACLCELDQSVRVWSSDGRHQPSVQCLSLYPTTDTSPLFLSNFQCCQVQTFNPLDHQIMDISLLFNPMVDIIPLFVFVSSGIQYWTVDN